MGRKRSVRNCKTAREFIKCVKKQGGYVENGSRHAKVYSENGGGMVTIPRHNGDLATGTRHSIKKGLLALGFLLFVGTCIAVALLPGMT